MAVNIVTLEQPEYRQILINPANQVSFPLSQEDKKLISSMKVKLEGLGGVGLAAPQVNSSKQIVAIYIPEEAKFFRDNLEKTYAMHILINPTYEPVSNSQILYDFEGCYSVANKSGKVPRYKEIKLTYYDELGQYHSQLEKNFYARVLQHEIDHINGILIVDRLTPDCVQGTVEEMTALRRAQLPDDKKAIYDSLVAKKQKK